MPGIENNHSTAEDQNSPRVSAPEASGDLLAVENAALAYIDLTSQITDRAEAIKAIHKLWSLHTKMEDLLGRERPAVLQQTRLEIHRLKQQFGVSTEEELADDETENE